MGNTEVLLLHGLFEHKGRHKINADWFDNLGMKSHLIDLPGHGASSKKKGDIDSWEDNDNAVINGFKNIQSAGKKILFGHSYGGLIATNAVLKEIVKPDYLILTAPLFEDNYPKFMRSLSRPLGNIAPKLRTISPITKRNLSTDKDVVVDYFKDPLVFRTFTFRLGAEIAFVQDYVEENINRLKAEENLIRLRTINDDLIDMYQIDIEQIKNKDIIYLNTVILMIISFFLPKKKSFFLR